MLEGLNIAETPLSVIAKNIDYRMEADYYTASSLDVPHFKGIEVLEYGQYNSTYGLNSDGKGYPIIRMNEFDNLFIGKPAMHFDKLDQDKFESLRLKRNDILMCRTNGNPNLIGKTAFVQTDLPYIYESHLFKIRINENLITPAFVHVFLNTKYGRNEINKLSMVGNQANFSIAKFKEISIPKFDQSIYLETKNLVFKSYNQLERSKKLYSQAENLLLKEIGLEDFTPSENGINIKNLSSSFATSGRLDAEYYQPKYEEYKKLVAKSNYSFVKNEYTHITKKSKKVKEGYNYIEIGNVNVGDGSNTSNYVLTEDLPANAKTIVKKGDILISKVRPYRGAVTIINSDLDDIIVSGAFTVLRSNDDSIFNNEVLKVLLRTDMYKDWLLKFNVGTSYPVIKDIDVLNMPIPIIEESKQLKIASLIQKSYELKNQSEQLLETAKRAVEIAIEQDEEAAIEYINHQNFMDAS